MQHHNDGEEEGRSSVDEHKGSSDFKEGFDFLRSLFAGRFEDTHRQARRFCDNAGGVYVY